MARKAISTAYINVALASASTTPEFKAGETVLCDSGLYVYGQANGAVAEGYICSYVEGTWDFTPIDTTISASTNFALGVCVATGGVADNYWCWWWRGLGKESVYVTDVGNNVQVTTSGTAGQGSTGGDPIHDLFTSENNSAAGLTACRSSVLLSTNATITN